MSTKLLGRQATVTRVRCDPLVSVAALAKVMTMNKSTSPDYNEVDNDICLKVTHIMTGNVTSAAEHAAKGHVEGAATALVDVLAPVPQPLKVVQPATFPPVFPMLNYTMAKSRGSSGYSSLAKRDRHHAQFASAFIVRIAPGIAEGFGLQCWHSLGQPRPRVCSVCTILSNVGTMAPYPA